MKHLASIHLFPNTQVSSIEAEKLLNEYVVKCYKMFYEVTIQVRKLAYEYPKSRYFTANFQSANLLQRYDCFNFCIILNGIIINFVKKLSI